MIIVTSVKKETVVGIMIVPQLLYMVGTEVENQYNHGKEGGLDVGNTIEKLNGNKRILYFDLRFLFRIFYKCINVYD